MKSVLSKLLFLLLVGVLPALGYSQDLTGIWKGYFITESGENYRLEFQVEQAKSGMVTGVSYSYLDTRFYGKSSMTGNYFIRNNSFTIQELRTIEVRNLGGGGTCLMNYKFTYSKSGKEEFLEGTYVGKTEDRTNPKNNGQWGDCGGGTVFLRRVTASDFYIEPFLRDKLEAEKKDTPARKTPPKIVPKTTIKKATKTPARSTTKTAPKTKPKPVAKTPAKKPTVKKPAVVNKPKQDTLQQKRTEPIVTEKAIERPKITIPPVTRARKNELTQTLTVTSGEIRIRLYDNGEIDDDTISVYLDGQLILSNKRLSATPITYTLKMDESNPEHVLVMVAENLGRIPPNTSLMIVQDGDKRYQVSITSTEQKNAMVRFRYQKPSD